MSRPKIIDGARSVIWMGNTQIGIFNSTSLSASLDIATAYILGRYTAASQQYVGASPVQLSCTGYRVINHGPLAVVDTTTNARLFAAYQDMALYDGLQVSIHDPSESDPTKSLIMQVFEVYPVSFNNNIASRSLSEFSVTFQGLTWGDETDNSIEPAYSASLP